MAIKFGNKGSAAAAAPAKIKPGQKGHVADNAGEGASLLPEDWSSGGLLNDADVQITDLTFVDDWTYEGRIESPVLALRATFTDGDGTETIQNFSAGDLSRFIPSPDGKRAVKAKGSTATALNNNTNCAAFIGSILEQGFPRKMVTDSVAAFEGTWVHVARIPQQKRSGIVQLDEKQRDVLVVTKLLALPGEKYVPGKASGKAAAGAGAAKPNGMAGRAKPAVATAADVAAEEAQDVGGDATDAAAEAIGKVLEEKGGSVTAKTLPFAILKHLAGNPQRADIIALVKNEEFLGAEGVPWTFDGTTISA